MVTQLAREAGADVGAARAAGRQTALDVGAQEFVDLDNDALEGVRGVDGVLLMASVSPLQFDRAGQREDDHSRSYVSDTRPPPATFPPSRR